ncbi:TIGR02444 family protein [Brevundimonas sp. LM2]|uniref:TIGR02444 family protein n=1 Tax=Brevundimonas sp. LM2 TaxID=1938605 RepID=UPI0009839974|nr:TIGR02444 family protein [Brevundimonas sp. LM2]AQR62524.1 TIGR02444 family protein [Brevundimonas sp. LM2]
MTNGAQAASDRVVSDSAPKGLWDWALTTYRAEGVSEACLTLQDQFGQNVPLLLWGAWAAVTGRSLDEDTVEAGCDAARAWDSVAVTQLRAMRRTLKLPVPDIDDAARLALRDQIKAVELAAERSLLAGLEALVPVQGGVPRPAIEGLVAVARGWSRVVPRPALIALAERLPA